MFKFEFELSYIINTMAADVSLVMKRDRMTAGMVLTKLLLNILLLAYEVLKTDQFTPQLFICVLNNL